MASAKSSAEPKQGDGSRRAPSISAARGVLDLAAGSRTPSASYVGRVGRLAVALGIAAAVATNPGIANATPEASATESDSTTTDHQTPTGSGATGSGAARTSTIDSTTFPNASSSTKRTVDSGSSRPVSIENSGGAPAGQVADVTDDALPSTSGGTQNTSTGTTLGSVPSITTTEPAPKTHQIDPAGRKRDKTPATPPDASPTGARVTAGSAGSAKSLGTAATLPDEDTAPTPAPSITPAAAPTPTAVDGIARSQLGAQPNPTAPPAAPATLPGRLLQAVHQLVASFTNVILASAAPGAPAGTPVEWALLAWVRRQLFPSIDDVKAASAQAVATVPTAAPLVVAAAAAAPVDKTAELQAKFDALKPGDTLYLPQGTYQHTGNLWIRVPNVTIDGNYSTLQATDPSSSAIILAANNVTLTNVVLSAPVGVPRQDTPYQAGLVMGADGVVVRNVAITGGAGAGLYITNASNFLIDRVYVADTAADGIHITAGSRNGVVNNPVVVRTGDDGIGIVSYASNPTPVQDIVVNSPIIKSALKTRGIAVVGGQRITINNVDISDTALSGIFVGSQGAPFYTASTSHVTVNGGTITGANWAPGLPFGAITLLSENPNSTVSDVTFSNLKIVNTATQYFNIGHANLSGTPASSISNIVYRGIAIQNPWYWVRPVFYAGAPPGTYTTTGFTMNGIPINL